MVDDALYQITLTVQLCLTNCGLGNHEQSFDLMVIKQYSGQFFEMRNLFEQQIDVELPLAFLPAPVVFLHSFPVQNDSEFGEHVENRISQENDKVEMFGPERSPVVFLENFIGHIQLVGILAVKFQKDQQKDNSPKQPTDVRKGLV